MAEGVAGFGGSVGKEREIGMEEQLGQEWKRKAAEADMRCCGDMLQVRDLYCVKRDLEIRSKAAEADMRCCGDMLQVRGHIFFCIHEIRIVHEISFVHEIRIMREKRIVHEIRTIDEIRLTNALLWRYANGQ